MIGEAINDAKINAELNEITNCEYFTGRAEQILSSVASRNRNKNLIAIVDPPRAGLRKYSDLYIYLKKYFRINERMLFIIIK